MYRGDLAPKNVLSVIETIKSRYKIKFPDWSKTGFKTIINSRPPCIAPGGDFPLLTRSICRISNTPGINNIFKGLKESYNEMYNKKEFIEQYISEGMEEQEIKEAKEELSKLENSYNELELQFEKY